MEDAVQTIPSTLDPSSGSALLESRGSSEEKDSTTMTIEFLRARLLSERSVSRAARQRAQQLAKKVLELEEQLEAEMQVRRKLEADRLEILSKYRAELNEEFDDVFASGFGEDYGRDGVDAEFHNSRMHDMNGGNATPSASNQPQGRTSNHRAELSDMGISPQQIDCEEPNDDEDDADEMDNRDKEKGGLSWGRQKGSRKDFLYSTDWLGRNILQRSMMSNEGDSSQKKWAGKSVRQIRKKDNRHYDVENGQTQAFEESDDKAGRGMRDQISCEDEREPDVEMVLEQQAEFIEKYEAEENAQRAWEAKYKEERALHASGNVEGQSYPSVKADTKKHSHSVNRDLGTKNEDTNLVVTEQSVSMQLLNDSTSKHSRKVHPEDSNVNLEVAQTHSESEPAVISSNGIHCGVGLQEEIVNITEADAEFRNRLEASSQDSSTGIDAKKAGELLVEHGEEPANKGKYNKRMSSSFRFAVFTDSEVPINSSPDMPGFRSCKQVGEKTDTPVLDSSEGTSEQRPDFDSYSFVHQGASSASFAGGTSQQPSVKLDDSNPFKPVDYIITRELESEEILKGTAEGLPEREGSIFHSTENHPPESSVVTGSSNPNPQGRDKHISNSPSPEVAKDPGSSQCVWQQLPGMPPGYSEHGRLPSRDFDRVPSSDFSMYPDPRSGMHGPPLNASIHENGNSVNNYGLVDNVDRVADVLRALQLAKLQIQSSAEQDVSIPGHRDDYDGKDPFYAEISPFPVSYPAFRPHYAAYPQPPRRPMPFDYNMHGWGTPALSGYGLDSSRTRGITSQLNYPPQMMENQNLWPQSPLHDPHVSNMYHYDSRYYR
ncbi:hypothetical protein KP509_32G022700 [Ceratopteris richardii]|uniref:Uncharacterized protein n=1 Tax=Ceratopteris richardii TaxID=49495 RepID=A0A8T2QTS9_CERRI|nr:hypothetical protein KP509_32G022700 [Ceratopteris richardii]